MEILTNNQLNTKLYNKIQDDERKNIYTKDIKLGYPFKMEETFQILPHMQNGNYNFHFEGCIFNEINLNNISTGSVLLDNCNVIEIKAQQSQNTLFRLEISNGSYGNIEFKNLNYSKIEISGAIVTSINLNSNSTPVYLFNLTCNKIKIRDNFNMIVFENSKFKDIFFSGGNRKLIKITESEIQSLNFEYFSCNEESKLILDGIKFVNTENILRLVESNLGKVVFKNINFRKVKWDVKMGSIGSIETYNVTWPYKLKLYNVDDFNATAFLKLIDNITSIKNDLNPFDKLNINALKLEAKRKSQKLTWGNFGNKLVLWLSKYTNYYRMEWIRPGLLFLILGIIFFVALIFSEGHKFNDVWGKLFVFYNPAHKIDFLNTEGLKNNLSYFIDFIGRLFSAFLIFQFIQGFRKFIIK